MRTISKSDIERSVKLLNDMTGNTKKFGIECSYGGCRLTSNDGSVNISERGTKRETYTFIRAYIDGAEYGYGHAMREVSKLNEAKRKPLTRRRSLTLSDKAYSRRSSQRGVAYDQNGTKRIVSVPVK